MQEYSVFLLLIGATILIEIQGFHLFHSNQNNLNSKFKFTNYIANRNSKHDYTMHIGHNHHHHHGSQTHIQLESSESSKLSLFEKIKSYMLQHYLRIIISTILIAIPSLIRRKFTKLDFGIFVLVASGLTVVDTVKSTIKESINKLKLFHKSVLKHSTPITKNYFFKNENAADRITLLGVFINIILSVIKFIGGISKLSQLLFKS